MRSTLAAAALCAAACGPYPSGFRSGAPAWGWGGAPGTGGSIAHAGSGGGGSGGAPGLPELAGEPGELLTWPELPPVEPGPRGTGASLCRPDGWCWTTPLPTGSPLRLGWSGSRGTWFAGTGELLLFDGVGFRSAGWSLGMAPRSIHGAADDDVWAAFAAEVAHFDGVAWRRFAVPGVAVAAVAPGEAWLVVRDGESHTLVHATGGAFRRWRFPGEDVFTVAAGGGVVVIGSTGGTLRWTGERFRRGPPELAGVTELCVASGGVPHVVARGTWRWAGEAPVLLDATELEALRCEDGVIGRDAASGAWVRLDPDGLNEVDTQGRAHVLSVEADGTAWTYGPGLYRGTERRGDPLELHSRTLELDPDGSVWAVDPGAAHHEGKWTAPLAGTENIALSDFASGGGVWGAIPAGIVDLRRPTGTILALGRPLLASSPSGAYAMNGGGAVHVEDGIWRLLPPVAARFPYDLTAGPAGLFALVHDAEAGLMRVLRFSGGAWSPVVDSSSPISKIFVTPRGDVWTAGSAVGRLREGLPRHVMVPGMPVEVSSVAVAGEDVWVLTAGSVQRRSGGKWSLHAAEGARKVRVSPSGDVWMFGRAGRLHRWDGEGLVRVETGTTADLRGIGFAGDEVLLAGSGGTLLRGRPGAFRRLETGTDRDLLAVAATGNRTYVGLAGIDGGAGLHELRAGKLEPIVGATRVFEIVARAPDDIWVAAEPRALHYDGDRWRQVQAAPATALAVRSSTEVYFVYDDLVRRYDGRSTQILITGLGHSQVLADVAASDHEIWLAGTDGLLRGDEDGWTRDGGFAAVYGNALLAGRDELQWAGGPSGELFHVRDFLATEVTAYPGKLGGLVVDPHGMLWALHRGADEHVPTVILRRDASTP